MVRSFAITDMDSRFLPRISRPAPPCGCGELAGTLEGARCKCKRVKLRGREPESQGHFIAIPFGASSYVQAQIPSPGFRRWTKARTAGLERWGVRITHVQSALLVCDLGPAWMTTGMRLAKTGAEVTRKR